MLLFLLPALAYSTGVTGYASTGCGTCHGATAASTTTATITPADTSVEIGETISIRVSVASSVGRTYAGFNAAASDGTLIAGSNNQLVLGELTHLAPTARSGASTNFTFTWTAPATPGTVTIAAAGNAVDNNGSDSGDGWRVATAVTINVTEPCVDDDGDGYEACPDGTGADCDDTDPAVNPDALEYCDEIDWDCDGDAELNAVDATTTYLDNDGDGYGSASTRLGQCTVVSGRVLVAGDCDDASEARNPGVAEVCDEADVDEDCDGRADDDDDDAEGTTTFYRDRDEDGYGNPREPEDRCDLADGYQENDDDCADGYPDVSPEGVEVCDEGRFDEDCDGLYDDDDDSVEGRRTWYVDADGDRYGDDSTRYLACVGYDNDVVVGGDCDDTSRSYNPIATESCEDGRDLNCDGEVPGEDADGDGWSECLECDDADPTVSPDAPETCNGVDDNCDGDTDGADSVDATAWYADRDGDGFGDPGDVASACSQPADRVADANDCDDTRADVHPGAAERCDAADADEDCDGLTDDLDAAPTGTKPWYVDADGDGWGGATSTDRCDPAGAEVADPGDCDDAVATTHPGAAEACGSPIDQDCDGAASDIDADRDGWFACAECDDGNPAVSPAAAERCNGIDDNCDGALDGADAVDPTAWHLDADDDGFGDPAVTTAACEAPEGYLADGSDCDDARPEVSPAADEVCDADATDEDCDGLADDADSDTTGTTAWYADGDADGYGAGTASWTCLAGPGQVAEAGDCNDASGSYHPDADEPCSAAGDFDCDGVLPRTDGDGDGWQNCADCDDASASVNPDAGETCDGVDEDCDGLVDDDAAGASTWFLDADGDAYGTSATTAACTQPDGYAAATGDCDDSRADVSPGSPERCDDDDLDEDCDGLADDADASATGQTTFYGDADGDGHGAGSTTSACEPPAGSAATSDDCDDTDAAVYPGAPEYCGGGDEDCDGDADDGAVDATVWYADLDGDGFGTDDSASASCSRPPNGTVAGGDCDDDDDTISPGALELWYDGIDQNCDGNDADRDGDGWATPDDCDDGDAAVSPGAIETWYDGVDGNCDGADDFDADADGHQSESTGGDDCDDGDVAVYPGAPGTDGDGVPNDCDDASRDDRDGDGYSDTDCDDANSAVHPGAAEVWYDGLDQDCDGNDDDQDGDGVAVGTDCDDEDASVFPGARETWYDGIDQNCVTGDEYDQDGDGVDSASWGGTDCDDADAATYPGAADTPYDGVVNDCDAADEYDQDGDDVDWPADCDDADSSVGAGPTWYEDSDADGYGDPVRSIAACTQPEGYVANDDDCNDANIRVNPDAPERWYNGVDEDCDGNDDDQDEDGHAVDADCDDEDPRVWDDCETGGETDSGETGDDTGEETGEETAEETAVDTADDTSPETAPETAETDGTGGTGALDDTGPKGARSCGCGTGAAPSLAGLLAAALLARRRR